MLDHLSSDDIGAAIRLRHALHRAPEPSGAEAATARTIADTLAALSPDALETGIGGHGVTARFDGVQPGPLIVLRAELDALPITEDSGVAHASEVPGHGHLCGHDGHMATLVAVARALSRARPARGAVLLLFQPAEETGAGARAMLDDPRISGLRPAGIFAQHNLPGLKLGTAALREGPAACASRGMRIGLSGRAAHASTPESGRSPRAALAHLLAALDGLNAQLPLGDPGFAMLTVTHCRMGAPAFGIAPGEAEVRATLRTLRDEAMAGLVAAAEGMAQGAAGAHGLGLDISHHDVFDATVNAPEAVAMLRGALDEAGMRHGEDGQPWRPSEDFGQFARLGPVAMMFTGAGEAQPALHDPAYDYPDALIEPAAHAFLALIARTCGD